MRPDDLPAYPRARPAESRPQRTRGRFRKASFVTTASSGAHPPRSIVDLGAIGWDDAYGAELETYAHCEAGRVVRVDRGVCTVLTRSGPVRASACGDLLAAMAKNATAGPCTGDWCAVRHWSDAASTVEGLLPRRSAIKRAVVSGRSEGQVLAANVDLVGIVVPLIPDPVLGKLERLLALAWESGAAPVVLLTKADLVSDAEMVAEDVRAAAPGAEVLCCSVITGDGIEQLRTMLAAGGTLALIGSSGGGKSSLANALVGAEILTTRPIRDDGRGRHTSVRRELVTLPAGGALIDTPGLRGAGLIDAADGIAATFADVESLVAECRFNDCSHVSEPDCAVQAAVADGTLPYRRYESWLKLHREMAWMERRTNARLRAEQNKLWKQFTRANRNTQRNRP
jgi:ribosome biogenesis GTPase / thiamine phosphate phosphatase